MSRRLIRRARWSQRALAAPLLRRSQLCSVLAGLPRIIRGGSGTAPRVMAGRLEVGVEEGEAFDLLNAGGEEVWANNPDGAAEGLDVGGL